MNEAGIILLKKYEGCKLKAYFDVSGFAIGYGHHGPDIEANTVWTQEMADKALDDDLAEYGKELDHMLMAPVTENQYSALLDFVYNLGPGSLHKSHLLQYLNDGDANQAAGQFLRWDLVDGQPNTALLERRMDEKALFLTPDKSLDGVQAVA